MNEHNRLNRRQFARLGIGLTALFAAHVAMASDIRSSDGLGNSMNLRDNCYWVTRQTTIRDGRRWEYRCEICCAGGVCETVACAWIDAGPA